MAEQAPEKAAVELVKLTVNGVEIEVPKGSNLIQAAKVAGFEVPHFCYHPGLKTVAVCRQFGRGQLTSRRQEIPKGERFITGCSGGNLSGPPANRRYTNSTFV